MGGSGFGTVASELGSGRPWVTGGEAGEAWPTGQADRVSEEVSPGRGTGEVFDPPRLVDLVDILGPLPGFTAVAGLDEGGSPVLLPLKSRFVWNLLITGPASSGKSEWLRALVMSLAMTSAPDKLAIVAVDLSGRELAVLESLPHTVARPATSLNQASELLAWIDAEMERRLRGIAGEPDLAVVVDDLRWGDGAEGVHAVGLLGRLWARGWQAGIHILAAGRAEPAGRGACARGLAVGRRPGWFDLATGRETVRVRACGLSAWDLDQAARRAVLDHGRAAA